MLCLHGMKASTLKRKHLWESGNSTIRKKKELKDSGVRPFDQMLSVVCDQKYMLVKNKHGEDMYISKGIIINKTKIKQL